MYGCVDCYGSWGGPLDDLGIRRKIERLWFVYGNNGPKHSDMGHKFIQGIVEHGEWLEDFYNPPKEVVDAVMEALQGAQ